ncbi:hypothetical protein AKJ59_00335 [candidate division MSBL1 archaeon SCGC-AAA385M02]|uniref:DNA-directed RNA polymerase M/15kDa subunit domain-containing protein n=1 Tax=candidate division MSBL1 archaeon SCGC-AAA385M02 TaxID=1698287 RepID=A0A133VR06_9EURY|nr:hypothetical protein AKJ59_00335 [candidate division MSBL1 archaeon SCGC-AAA385M02]
MHFCSKCDNMYYIRINENDNNKLVYYCRNCGNVDNELSMTNLCVSKTKIRQNKQIYSHMINEYTKNDVTLPRTKTIKCPNQDCKSNKKKENENENEAQQEVIYLRYDDINMKYIYMCVNCNTTWKTSQKQ